MDKFLYKEESFKIGDACKEVRAQSGGSFKESIVDKALTITLQNKGLLAEDQKRIDSFFAGKKFGTYILDKMINGGILLEVKCKPFLTVEDQKQFRCYIKATKYRSGFLINLGPSLSW